MPITYTSRYHCAEDPGGIVHEALTMGSAFPGPARDLVLSWMLRLGDEIEPAEAARRLLAEYGLADGRLPEGPCGELVKLLRETATYPQARLDSHLPRHHATRGRRRRG